MLELPFQFVKLNSTPCFLAEIQRNDKKTDINHN